MNVSAPLAVTRLTSALVAVTTTSALGALCSTAVQVAVPPSTTFNELTEISTVAASAAAASHVSASSSLAPAPAHRMLFLLPPRRDPLLVVVWLVQLLLSPVGVALRHTK